MADERGPMGPSAHDLTIFISYRRSDTRADAGRLYDSLRRRFGKDQLFMDVDTLLPGQDWVDAVEGAVARCDVLLALIGDEWSTVVDASGRRRIEDDLDRVRLEIEAALKQDKPVIPVLFDDAGMPGADELPASLQSLRRRHAMRLAHDTFRYDLEPLIHALRNIETAKRARLGLPPRVERSAAASRTTVSPAVTTAAEPTPVETPPLPAQPTPPIAAASAPAPAPQAPAPATPSYAPAQPVYPPAPPPYQPTPPAYQPTPPTYQSTPPSYGQGAPAWPYQQQQPAPPSYQQPYPAPTQWPAQQPAWPPQQKGAAANPLSIVAIILGVVAFLILPIIFGPAAIIAGVVAKTRREPWANAAIVVGIAGLIGGFVLGYLAFMGS